MNPPFSVIIPTYNRADKLDRALQSLKAQSFLDFEVLVCDDGSTDHTSAVVKKYEKDMEIIYLWEENWGGPARPRNRGIRNSRGEWICFLDSDDWWSTDKLKEVYRYIGKADVIYHDVEVISEKDPQQKRKIRARSMAAPVINALMTKNNRIYNSSFSIKKSYIEKAGFVSEDKTVIAAEDYDLWIRIAKITDRFLRIPKCLAAYWIDSENITEISNRQIGIIVEVYSRHVKSLGPKIQKEAKCYMAYSVGRIRQKMGDFTLAQQNFVESIKSNRIGMKIKSAICILSIRFSAAKGGKIR